MSTILLSVAEIVVAMVMAVVVARAVRSWRRATQAQVIELRVADQHLAAQIRARQWHLAADMPIRQRSGNARLPMAS